jgi:hypothetical protein
MNNKHFIPVLALLIAVIAAGSAQAQKRKPATTTKKPTAAVTTTNALEIKDGASKAAIQLKNVTSFIYTLGGVAAGIEDADKEARANKLSRAAIDKNNQFKQAVIQSIRNLKAGLATLEVEFRTKPSLKPYLVQISGVTDIATQAEDLAASGRFTESGRSLILVVEKLADTLAAMP